MVGVSLLLALVLVDFNSVVKFREMFDMFGFV